MEAQMYLPSYMREVAQSGNLNHNQHANYVELLADFAEKRDKEFYALRNECNDLKTIAFHLGEDKLQLLAENERLQAENEMLREALKGMEKWASSIYDGYPPSTASIAAAPYREAARAAIAKTTRGEQ